jgi:hypothetical protein
MISKLDITDRCSTLQRITYNYSKNIQFNKMCFIELKQTQTLENVVGGQTNYKILDQKMD